MRSQISAFGFWLRTRFHLPPATYRLPLATFILLVIASMLVAACGLLSGGGGPALGSDTALQGNALLTCSQTCLEQGQCGQTAERGPVVLVSTIARVTRNQDLAIPNNTPVVILQVVPETMVVAANTSQLFSLNYYLISLPDSRLAWVAGWCIANQ